MEKFLLKTLKTVSSVLTVVFIGLSYGGDPVAWAGSFGMSVASLSLLFIPEEEF